jgi:mannose-6-phosphate isomerase class I
MSSAAIKLKCAVQKYDWGKRGSSSLVAQLSGEKEQPDTPYAGFYFHLCKDSYQKNYGWGHIQMDLRLL